MELKLLFGLAAVVCELMSAAWYYRDIYHGNTKPHLYTHFVFAIVMSIGFLGITVGGGEAGAWAFLVSIVFETSLIPISLWWGTKDIKRLDSALLVLALFAMVPWILTRNPLWSVILISFIDVLAMLPTIRKTYNEPTSEPLAAWLLAMLRTIFQIAALGAYSLATVLYPLEIISIEVVLVAVILFRGTWSKRLFDLVRKHE